MNQIEKTGKTPELAILEALRELECTREDAEITVLDEGSRGFLGIGAKPAVVLVKKKFDPVKTAINFLREVSAAMGMAVSVDAELKEDRHLYIDLQGENMGILIGKRGQTLDSLQYLTSLAVNKGDAQYVSVHLDTENYRQRRKDTLENLSRNLARKVKKTRKNIVLEPMTPNERRIIHSALQNDRFVTTYSEGDEPYRYIVIASRKPNERSNRNHKSDFERN